MLLVVGLPLFALGCGSSPGRQARSDDNTLRSLRAMERSPSAPDATKARRITPADLRPVQQRAAPALKRCYEAAARRGVGDVHADITLAVNDAGAVDRVTVTGVADALLRRCLQRGFSEASFPPVGRQQIAFPIVFRGGNDDAKRP